MKRQPRSPDPAAAAAAELRVSETSDGGWTWRYVEPSTGVELYSNSTYAARQGAVDAAARAYPDLSLADEEEGKSAGGA